MPKIFPMRTYNPAKNVAPVAHQEAAPEPPKIDYAAERAAIEAAKRERMEARRAAIRAAAREQLSTAVKIGMNVHHVSDGLFRFFNVDVVLMTTLFDAIDAKRMPSAAVMHTLRPIKNWILNDVRCWLCDGRLCDEESRFPSVVFSARAKPPSKKRPVGPACVCNLCMEDKGWVEIAMFAYTHIADGTADLGMTSEEIIEALAKIKKQALNKRGVSYDDTRIFEQDTKLV